MEKLLYSIFLELLKIIVFMIAIENELLSYRANNARWCLRIRERRSFPATLCLELHSTTAGSSSNIFLNVLRIYEGQSYSAENKWGFR